MVANDWKPSRHLIAARAVRKDSRPEPWRNLGFYDPVENVMENMSADRCKVKPIFMDAGSDEAILRTIENNRISL